MIYYGLPGWSVTAIHYVNGVPDKRIPMADTYSIPIAAPHWEKVNLVSHIADL
jgi:hypothetical protein